jgi:DNA gyrase/topoisomerase IV subunit B
MAMPIARRYRYASGRSDLRSTASEIFSTLMGDIVEPRREFTQDNAVKVSNLDV